MDRWTHKDDSLLLALFCKLYILTEESVARMDGLGPGLLGHLEYLVGPEIGLTRGRGPDPDRLVRHGHVHAVPVRVAVH